MAAPEPAQAAQIGWRWCYKCGSLWRPDTVPVSVCPAEGHHSGRSWNYQLKVEADGGPGVKEWRQCTNCAALWWRGDGNRFTCPRGGRIEGHNEVGWGKISPPYLLETTASNSGGQAQANWKRCSMCNTLVHNDTDFDWVGRCAGGGQHYTGGANLNYRLRYTA
jgi:hypothetical protein